MPDSCQPYSAVDFNHTDCKKKVLLLGPRAHLVFFLKVFPVFFQFWMVGIRHSRHSLFFVSRSTNAEKMPNRKEQTHLSRLHLGPFFELRFLKKTMYSKSEQVSSNLRVPSLK